MITYVLPTRDRPHRLAQTLASLGALRGHDPAPGGPGEVIVVDNASHAAPDVPARLANGLRVHVLRRETNEGAASRNAGVRAADDCSEWVVMLDDDSCPTDTGFLRRLLRAPDDVAAVSADIYLPGLAHREIGGLPEVFIGCGVAIRRRVFLDLGGYDAAFNYYAEEYDLAARMIAAGYRIAFDPWFRVEHHKVAQGRDFNVILARLVRNNGWVMQRYAPEEMRRDMLRDLRRRYRAIGRKENAGAGFTAGLTELRRTIAAQRRTPMTRALFERFMGLAQAREALAGAMADKPFATAAIVDEGKNGWVVRRALAELGVRLVPVDERPDVRVIGTMSPGPMLDAYERRTALPSHRGPRVLAPWLAVMERSAPRPADIFTAARREKVPA